MDVFRVTIDNGVFDVPSELTEWGQPYAKLHKQAPPGFVISAAYIHNRFNNNFHDADVKRYETRRREGKGNWYIEITHDTIEGRDPNGEASIGEGSIPVLYKTNAGMPDEMPLRKWAPKSGLVVPVADNVMGCRFFQTFTLLPERTIPFDERAEAERIYLQFDLPTIEISGFHRPDDYKAGKKFVGRHFNPNLDDSGRFDVNASRLPSHSGAGRVGSRPAYAEHNVIGEIDLRTAQEVRAE